MCFFFLSSTNVVMNYTEIEAKVREATNDDSWGPTGTQHVLHICEMVNLEFECCFEYHGLF
jgi:hypothetical protein